MLSRKVVWVSVPVCVLALTGISKGQRNAAAKGIFDSRELIVAYPQTVQGEGHEVPHSALAQDASEGQRSLTARRPVTVADIIRMTRVAGPGLASQYYTGAMSSDFAVFSPDRKRFVIVVKKGNLEQNTNEYSMLLYETDKVFDAPSPRILTSIASSSNSEGIKDITWLDDNDTIFFLGKRSGETAQLYSIGCTSGKVEQLSHLSANVVGYSASTSGKRIVVGIENPVRNLLTADALRNGIKVSPQDMLGGFIGHGVVCCQSLFILEKGVEGARAVHIHDALWENPLELFPSPNGRFLVVKTIVREVPPLWGKYTADDVKRMFAAKFPKGEPTFFRRYEVIDTETDASQILVDSPVSFEGSDIGWSRDSQSVIVTGVYLPLNVADSSEFVARQSRTFPVEVRVPSLEIIKIADHDMKFIGWDTSGEHAMFRPNRSPNLSGTSSQIQYYRRVGPGWEPVASDSSAVIRDGVEIAVEQDLNMPPRVTGKDLRTGKQAIVLDLNPQFHDLSFGKVEEVKWIGGEGKEVSGGLYLPPEYVPGEKYPLVIQTHGFDPHGFWPDGPFTTAYAAQPLAGKGIVVLQIPDSHDFLGTIDEAPRMVETYEKAIDYLNGRGLIDLTRVGIIGWSRTCFYVRYMLTHSKYHVAAASVADGFDSGYFDYVLSRNHPVAAAVQEDVIGGQPFGDGLSLWLKRSTSFLLDKVETPVRLEAHGGLESGGILSEWEWYSGLARLGKPVELIYLPDGAHILEKPWERMVSQQGNVDWFCFWLKGEEDPDPAKAEQYARWRELRKLQGASVKPEASSG